MRIAHASEGKSSWIEEREGRDWRRRVQLASRKVISCRIWRIRVCWGGGRVGRDSVRLESRIKRRARSPYMENDGECELFEVFAGSCLATRFQTASEWRCYGDAFVLGAPQSFEPPVPDNPKSQPSLPFPTTLPDSEKHSNVGARTRQDHGPSLRQRERQPLCPATTTATKSTRKGTSIFRSFDAES